MSLFDTKRKSSLFYLKDPIGSLCSFLPSTHAKKTQSSGNFPSCFLKTQESDGHSEQFTFIILEKKKYIIFIASIFHAYLPLDLIFQVVLLAARVRFK